VLTPAAATKKNTAGGATIWVTLGTIFTVSNGRVLQTTGHFPHPQSRNN
jgi:hypothetical protein